MTEETEIPQPAGPTPEEQRAADEAVAAFLRPRMRFDTDRQASPPAPEPPVSDEIVP